MDSLTHNAYQEPARMVPALGGRDKVLEIAKAKVATDPQWAARLATYLILSDEGDNEARQVRQQASVRFAQVTTSTNSAITCWVLSQRKMAISTSTACFGAQ